MDTIPRNGTKAAVDYWAVRARDSVQTARAILRVSADKERAHAVAVDAAGEAAEFEQAVRAWLDEEASR